MLENPESLVLELKKLNFNDKTATILGTLYDLEERNTNFLSHDNPKHAELIEKLSSMDLNLKASVSELISSFMLKSIKDNPFLLDIFFPKQVVFNLAVDYNSPGLTKAALDAACEALLKVSFLDKSDAKSLLSDYISSTLNSALREKKYKVADELLSSKRPQINACLESKGLNVYRYYEDGCLDDLRYILNKTKYVSGLGEALVLASEVGNKDYVSMILGYISKVNNRHYISKPLAFYNSLRYGYFRIATMLSGNILYSVVKDVINNIPFYAFYTDLYMSSTYASSTLLGLPYSTSYNLCAVAGWSAIKLPYNIISEYRDNNKNHTFITAAKDGCGQTIKDIGTLYSTRMLATCALPIALAALEISVSSIVIYISAALIARSVDGFANRYLVQKEANVNHRDSLVSAAG
jgi:hypothetical protein